MAVNTDESACRLKGPGRPLLPLAERLELLAALECVDWVAPFEGNDVKEVLRRVRPAIHAKGTDYTVETVPERAVARELGVQTVIAGDPRRRLGRPDRADPRGRPVTQRFGGASRSNRWSASRRGARRFPRRGASSSRACGASGT